MSEGKGIRALVRFGSFRIDFAAERLWNGSDPIALRPKTWSVLRFLADHAGELVEKESLLDAIWGDVAVEEKVLNASIAEIRQALGDSARQPRYVETVHRRGFRFIAPLDAKSTGESEPMPAWHVDAAQSSFVGRQIELSALLSVLVGGGQPRQVVVVSGNAGVGKSRLVAEALGRTGAHVLLGRCIEGGGVPYLPWVEMIRVHLRSVAPDASYEDLGEAATELSRLLPALAMGSATPPPAADPELARLRLFESIASFFETVAHRHRLVAVVEDLHWADGASLRALQILAPRLLQAGAVVLTTLRDEEAPAHSPVRTVLQALARDGLLRALPLEALPAQQAQQLIRQVGGDSIPTPVIERIARGSEGNPFFIEEILRHLGDLELLDRASGQWRSHLLRGELELPPTVTDVFERRVRRLHPNTRLLLDAAAVIGVEVDETLLTQVLDLDDVAFAASAGEALGAGILQESPSRPGRYRFGHALMRFALYELLSTPLRRRWHMRVADAIEALRGDARDALLDLAFHSCRAVPAVPPGRAFELALRAAERAQQQFAYEAEAEHYRSALHLTRSSGADEILDRQGELAVRYAEALQRAGDAEPAARSFREAAELARRRNDPECLARAALGMATLWEFDAPDVPGYVEEALDRLGERNEALRTRLLARLAVVLYPLPGTRARCEQLTAEALANARRSGDPTLLGQTLTDWLAGQWYPDNLQAQQSISDELLGVAERSGDQALRATAHGWRAVIGLGTGAISLAQREVASLAALASDLRQPTYQWCGLYLSATLALLRGELLEAQRLARDAFAIGQRCSPKSALTVYSGQIITIRREQDRMAELLPMVMRADGGIADHVVWVLPHLLIEADMMEEGRAAFARACACGFETMLGDNSRNRALISLGAMAHACAVLEDAVAAAALYPRIEPHAHRWAVSGFGMVCYGLMGNGAGALAACLHRWKTAEQHFEAIIAEYERVGAVVALARGLHLYAAMLLGRDRRGDRKRAGELVERATTISQDLGLARVAKLLSRLPHQAAR
jgi:DNA-binding winged helix-turn-helix (wHTH) protein/tetratricopeptide (TPR) repeat protein